MSRADQPDLPPLDPDVERELLRLGTATLYEAAKQPYDLPATLRPTWPGAAVVGRALPVRTAPGDNLPLHLAVEAARPGEVLVVAAGGVPCGYWGEVLTVAAQHRGVRGLVIDGGVRDTTQMAALDFPVFSSSVAIRGTVKQDPGAVGEPLRLGDVVVHRGDVLVGDADGLVVIPAQRLAAVVEAGRRRESDEAEYLRRLAAGELTLDIYQLRTQSGQTPR